MGGRHQARLGKIDADPHELAAAIDASRFLELPVGAAHAAEVATLELHHNDPFDRLLIAQALVEPLKLVTVDEVLAKYSDVVLLVLSWSKSWPKERHRRRR